MSIELNGFEQELLKRYDAIMKPLPEWAFPMAAPIPFVGNEYGNAKRPRVLVYASAENLGHTWPKERTLAFWQTAIKEDHCYSTTLGQRTRSRLTQSADVRKTSKPSINIHMAPISNGGLLAVARHILELNGHGSEFDRNNANGFLEQIAVANPGKFSIRPNDGAPAVNLDYAGGKHWRKFEEQLEYLQADIESLDPNLLMIPSTVLQALCRPAIRDRWGGISGRVDRIVATRQVQLRAIQRKHGSRIPQNKDLSLPAEYAGWTSLQYAHAYMRWISEETASKPAKFTLDRVVQL